jgi:phosphatidate cytidylyltransferase
MQQRAVSAIFIVLPLFVALALGEPGITLLVVILVALGSIEAFRLLRSAGDPVLPWLGVAFALVVAVVIAVGLDANGPFPDLTGSAFVLASVGLVLVGIGAFARTDPRDGLSAWSATVFGALYVAQLGFVVRLGQVGPALPSDAPLEPLGPVRGWILLLIFGVWSYDTGAYLVGRQIGRHKFLTHISPSKTLEGLAGGLIATTLVTLLMLWALGQPVWHGLILGPLLGVVAQAGDLAESMLKRAAGAKDSSNLIPGHGGILDRIDSFLFAAPVVTLYVLAVLQRS